MRETITLRTSKRNEMVDITFSVQQELDNSDFEDGICTVFVPHTTAGITINEGADPDVCIDMIRKLNQLAPPNDEYRHREGNSDSHIKTSLVGNSVSVIVEKGLLILGTWQRIFLCEFDGPRSRKIYVKAG